MGAGGVRGRETKEEAIAVEVLSMFRRYSRQDLQIVFGERILF